MPTIRAILFLSVSGAWPAHLGTEREKDALHRHLARLAEEIDPHSAATGSPERLLEALEALCSPRQRDSVTTAKATKGRSTGTGDIKVVGHSGEEKSSDENPDSGSWNFFHQYAALPDIAVPRPNPAVLKRKILTGEINIAALQRRLTNEVRIWHLLAAVALAPMIYGMKIHRQSTDAGDIDLYTTIPEKFAMSVDKYLGRVLHSRAELSTVAEQIVSLCFGVADLGYCHLDIKLGNVVLNTHPIDVRLIDFDPQYMRDIGEDSHLVHKVADTLSLSGADACNVVRLFYVLLMQVFIYLYTVRTCRKAAKRLPQEAILKANSTTLANALRRHTQRIQCPFSIFFTVPSLATSDLMRLAANRVCV